MRGDALTLASLSRCARWWFILRLFYDSTYLSIVNLTVQYIARSHLAVSVRLAGHGERGPPLVPDADTLLARSCTVVLHAQDRVVGLRGWGPTASQLTGRRVVRHALLRAVRGL